MSDELKEFLKAVGTLVGSLLALLVGLEAAVLIVQGDNERAGVALVFVVVLLFLLIDIVNRAGQGDEE